MVKRKKIKEKRKHGVSANTLIFLIFVVFCVLARVLDKKKNKIEKTYFLFHLFLARKRYEQLVDLHIMCSVSLCLIENIFH